MSRFDRSSERGAMLIHVALMLLALTAFSAFVMDYGIFWTARNDAQTAADAGALAAAINMMDNPSDTSQARTVAKDAAHQNPVFGELPAAADVLVDLPIPCPPPVGTGQAGCVRVDVQRGQIDRNGNAHTNVLPTFFATLMGINSQAIMATATAEVVAGNSVTCIKPWIVADKWTDSTPDTDQTTDPAYYGDSWDRDDTFDPALDTYNPANGFNPAFDTGYLMPLKPGNIGTWNSGWAMEIDFGCMGSQCYKDNIESCPTWVPTVSIWNQPGYDAKYPTDNCDAQNAPTDPTLGCLSVKTGMSQGPTTQGVTDLVAQDSGATWVVGDDPSTPDVEKGYVSSPCMTAGTCTDPNGNHVSVSPRIVPIAIFDTSAFVDETCSGTGCVARVVNLGGFFIEGMCFDVFGSANLPTWCGSVSDSKKIVIGRFMKYPGQWSMTGGTTTNAFAKAVTLVR
jgi:hypothetical protein